MMASSPTQEIEREWKKMVETDRQTDRQTHSQTVSDRWGPNIFGILEINEEAKQKGRMLKIV